MYSISEKLRRKMYEGGLIMTPQVYIGSTLINNSNIKSLKLSSPIIDKSSQTMYAGSFVSKQLELEFRNLQDLDLTQTITYNIHIEEEEASNPVGIANLGYRWVSSSGIRRITNSSDNKYALIYYACEPDTTYTIRYALPTSLEGKLITIGSFATTEDYPEVGTILQNVHNTAYTMSTTEAHKEYTTNSTANYLVISISPYSSNSPELTDYMDDIMANVSVEVIPDEATVPMGIYNIDSSPEDYYKKSKIVALDNAILFKKNINIKTLFDDGEEKITASDLLSRLCEYFGVTLSSYPSVNLTAKTGSYDNTISGKQYISYIAEIMGGNARIDRYGGLIIVPLKNPTTVTINALKAKSFTFGEEYIIEEVLFDTGAWAYNNPVDDSSVVGNTLVLRADNPFIYNGDDTYRKAVIDNIYNEVVGLDIYSITTENYIDITLDPEDIVTYTLGESSYSTYYDNTYEFNHTGKVATTIPTKQVERTTNVISGDERSDVRQLRTIIDQINNTLTEQATRIQTLGTDMTTADQEILSKFTGLATTAQLESLETTVTRELSDTYSKTQIDAIIRGTDESGNVVEYVKSGSATFDINGLTIDDSDTKVKSNYSANGLNVIDKTDNSSLLYAGFDETTQETVVRSKNLRVEKYFEMGTYSRFEDYVDDNGNAGTGCFWVGD